KAPSSPFPVAPSQSSPDFPAPEKESQRWPRTLPAPVVDGQRPPRADRRAPAPARQLRQSLHRLRWPHRTASYCHLNASSRGHTSQPDVSLSRLCPARSKVNVDRKLERTCKFLGEHLRFFRQAASAAPIRDLCGFPRVLDEASDFGHQVRLRGGQRFSPRGPKISLRNVYTLVRLLLGNRGFLRRKLLG